MFSQMTHAHTQILVHTNTCTYRHTQTQMQILFHILHFWLNWHTCQRYKFYIWCTTDIHRCSYTQIHTDTHIHVQAYPEAHKCTGTYRYRYTQMHEHTHTHAHKHTLRHTQTCACLYINTHTHRCAHWKCKEIFTLNPLLS